MKWRLKRADWRGIFLGAAIVAIFCLGYVMSH